MIFRQQIKENLVAGAIDTLVEEQYVRTYEDDEGITHLYKWYELDDLLPDAKIRIRVDDEEIEELTDIERIESMSNEEIEAILDELIEEDKRRKGK